MRLIAYLMENILRIFARIMCLRRMDTCIDVIDNARIVINVKSMIIFLNIVIDGI